VVLDASSPLTDDDRRLLDRTAVRARVIVANKSDLPAAPHEPSSASEELPGGPARQDEQGGAVAISATTGAGIVGLIRAIHTKIGIGDTSECALISNIRQIDLLGHSTEALRRAESTISETLGQTPEELVLVDLRLAVDYLQEVTGKRTTEELLNTIFSNFCIGK
jgi:tRNA modification GTPase